MPRLVGKAKALELILLSKRITPLQAFDIGLINQVSEPGKVMDDAMTLAEILANRPPFAVTSTLKTVGMALNTDIDKGIKTEIEEMRKLQGTTDIIEGFAAFLERREPNFKGK